MRLALQLVPADHPILRTRCRPDFTLTMRDIIEMFEIVKQQNALGLAASQVGIDARLFVTGWGEVFVNPSISEVRQPTVASREGCLSLPGVEVTVERWSAVRLADGRVYTGPKAAVIQHEINHLDGILITDAHA